MNMEFRIHKLIGSAMLEVLIAALVVGFILLALVHFQGTVTQTNSYAKTRGLAMQLAQAKVDDLRSFSQLSAGPAGTFGYSEIQNNLGGREQGDGTLELGSGDHMVTNVSYNLSWNCQEFSYDVAGNLGAGVPCSASTETDFKELDVTVSWLEPISGQNESVTMETVIHADDPLQAALSIVEPERPRPVIKHTPGMLPEFVPITITPGVRQESSLPEPDTTRHEHSTETEFDAVQYKIGTLDTLSRRAFVTVNCTCEQAGTGMGKRPSRPPLPDLNTATNLQTGVGAFVTKRIGRKKTGGQLNEQPALCDACCRDHHDDSGSSLKYDPFDPNGYPAGLSGDHNHYNRNNQGNLVLANNNGDTYIETCRFQRINGVLELVQDWKLANLIVLPAGFISAFSTDYANYVDQYIRDYINAIDGSYPGTTPTPAPDFPTAPTSLLIANNSMRTMQARAIYIDFMTSMEITDLKAELAMDADAHILPFVPWYEVNVTRLANWSVSNPNVLSVTDEPIDDGDEQNYSRGVIQAQSPGMSDVVATIEQSNSGLTDSFAISADDAALTSDALAISVSGAGSPPASTEVIGQIRISGAVLDVPESHVLVVGVMGSGASCTKPTQNSYKCVLTGGTGMVEFQNFQGTNPDASMHNGICPGSLASYSGETEDLIRNVLVIGPGESCPP